MRAFALPDHPTRWRAAARALMAAGLSPDDVQLIPEGASSLFLEPLPEGDAALNVNRSFLYLLERLVCADDPERHEIAYAILWRLTHGEPGLLKQPGDPLVRRARRVDQGVRREAHKTKAFVRFREAMDGTLVAFHRPHHRVLRLVSRFFCERFARECFAILTPQESLHWDGERARLGPGASPKSDLRDDDVEALWLTYYAAIFNPARVKTKAMKGEMPIKHWATLPETALIPELIRQAPARLEAMRRAQPPSARLLAAEAKDLDALARGLSACGLCPRRVPRERGCLERSERSVPGHGPRNPQLVIVGEQPGEHEDRSGIPLVGPAGEMLNRVLDSLGVRRTDVWISNAVKHFHHEGLSKPRRIHARPPPDVIERCRPWLGRELDLLGPAPVVCLGRSAALSVLGRRVTISEAREAWHRGLGDRPTRVTHHPALALRHRTEAARVEAELEADIAHALEATPLDAADPVCPAGSGPLCKGSARVRACED